MHRFCIFQSILHNHGLLSFHRPIKRVSEVKGCHWFHLSTLQTISCYFFPCSMLPCTYQKEQANRISARKKGIHLSNPKALAFTNSARNNLGCTWKAPSNPQEVPTGTTGLTAHGSMLIPLVLLLLDQGTCWITCRTCGSHMHLSRPTSSDGASQGAHVKISLCTGTTCAKLESKREWAPPLTCIKLRKPMQSDLSRSLCAVPRRPK